MDPGAAVEQHLAADEAGRGRVDDDCSTARPVAVHRLPDVIGEATVRPVEETAAPRADHLAGVVDAGYPVGVVAAEIAVPGDDGADQRMHVARRGLAFVEPRDRTSTLL